MLYCVVGHARVYLDLPASLPPCVCKLPGALVASLFAAGITSSGWPTNTGTTIGRARTMRRHPVGIWPGGMGGALLKAQGFRSSACSCKPADQMQHTLAAAPCACRRVPSGHRHFLWRLHTLHTGPSAAVLAACLGWLLPLQICLQAAARLLRPASAYVVASWLKQHSALASALSAGGAQRAQRRCTGCAAGAGAAQPVPPGQLCSSSCRLAAC